MTAIAFLLMLSASAQGGWHLPVTIEVAKDVHVKPYSELQKPDGSLLREERGVLYVGRELKAFRIEEGETFQMIEIQQEGGCRIRFQKSEYNLPSCPWLDGFSDHQADIFQVIGKK